MKKKLKITMLVILGIIFLPVYIVCCNVFYQGFLTGLLPSFLHWINPFKQRIEYADRFDVEARQKLAKMDEQIYHLKEGRKHEKDGQYDLAVEEYKKAIEAREDWIGHAYLADVYEKTGQNELAIKELDWLISQKQPRQIDEYQARKRKLVK